jgi:hypothetical protein
MASCRGLRRRPAEPIKAVVNLTPEEAATLRRELQRLADSGDAPILPKGAAIVTIPPEATNA